MTKTAKSKKEQALDYSAERTEALKEADAEFAAAVAKAAEKRDAVYAKWPDAGNLAERAWNTVKSEEDPLYKDVVSTFRAKLDTAAEAIRETGNADIVGLEDFEAEVNRIIAEEGVPKGTAFVSTSPEAADEVVDEKTTKKAKTPKE